MEFPFPAYAEDFLEHLKECGRSRSTLIRYRSDIQKFLNWLHVYKGKESIQNLTLLSAQDYKLYIKSLEDSKLSDATIKRLVTVLNGLLNYLGIVSVHLLKESSKSRPLRQLTDKDFVSSFEFKRLIKSMGSSNDYGKKTARDYLIERNLSIVYLMRFYGLTPAEIAAIDMKDINLAQRTLIIYGSTGSRRATIDKKHLQNITAYLNSIDALKRPRIRTEDALFVAFNNTSNSFQFDYAISRPKRLSIRSIQEMLKDEVQRANLRKISGTNLRNSCIIDYLMASHSDEETMSHFGLSDAYSLRRYREYLK